MSNQLHHTIREHPAAQWLLCRQWKERINFEYAMLKARAETSGDDSDLKIWYERLELDLATVQDRASEDGFAPHITGGTISPLKVRLDQPIPDIFRTGSLRFMPDIWSLIKDGCVTHAIVWTHNEVQP